MADEADPAGHDHLGQLETRGWVVIPGALAESRILAVRHQLKPALQRRERVRRLNGVDGDNDGTLHHLLCDDLVFLDSLGDLEQFNSLIRHFLSGNYVLNSFGGVVNVRDSRAYVHKVHRDIRFSSATRHFMLNCLIMLDDFTPENGATYVLSGSQSRAEPPSDEHFLATAERALGSAGSVLFFDSRLWHATGENRTDTPRRALTLTFTSPFYKPQLDYARQFGYERAGELSPHLRQVIGFNARIPATLEEFYVPVERRFYQRGQDE